MINKKMIELGTNRSSIRELFEYGKKLKLEVGEENVFDFSIGNPSVPTPEIVTTTLKNLLEDPNIHAYTSAPGDLFTRNKIAENLNQTYGVHETGDFIYMTCGAAASLTITLNAICNPQDEIIVFTPYFPEYKVFIENAQAKVVEVRPNQVNFEPDFVDFENKITEKTKAIIIDSPNNPTGAIYSVDTIKKLSSILKNKEKEYQHPIYLISDEPYRELIYTNDAYPFVTNYYDDAIICYSFSKSLSLPGERIGYILVGNKAKDKELVFSAICGAGRALGFVCAPSVFQHLIPSILGITSDISVYKENRDIMYQALTQIGYEVIKPSGAFYMFVKALEEDDQAFSDAAKKMGLLLVPSKSFGYPGFVRISYCVAKEVVQRSIPVFERLFNEYKK